MRHGVLVLPEHRWVDAQRIWRHVEELGFDHAWTYDHLMWRWLRAEPWFGSVPTLTAAAAATSRLRLGMLVTGPDFRHPVPFAKDVMTLDDVSQGRMVCGLGAGAGGFDAEVLGAPALDGRARARRFTEFVELTDGLLRDPVTDHEGEFFTAREAHMHPGCLQRPRVPFAVAATGPRAMRVAARHADTWVTAGAPARFDAQRIEHVLPDLRKQSEAFDDACVAEGRDPKGVDRLFLAGATVGGVLDSVEAYQHAAGALDEIGFTDLVVHRPRPAGPYAGDPAVLEDVAREVLGR